MHCFQVKDAIATCRKAGISVHMVTGDSIVTAKAVAIKSGIMSAGGDSVVYTGKDFNDFIRDSDGKVRLFSAICFQVINTQNKHTLSIKY